MPVEKPNRLAVYWQAFTEWLPTVRPRLWEWWEAVREEPGLVWQSTAFRCGLWAVGGLVVLSVVSLASDWIAPSSNAPAAERAETANFEVICSNSSCGHRFMIERPFGFNKFPVPCPKCKQKTGLRAVRCDSPSCKGRMVAPVPSDRGLRCDQCGAGLTAHR